MGEILTRVKDKKNTGKRKADYPVNIQDDLVIGMVNRFSPGCPASFPVSCPGFAEP